MAGEVLLGWGSVQRGSLRFGGVLIEIERWEKREMAQEVVSE